MYAPSRIEEKLKSATVHLGWRPEYHALDEVVRFNEHMKSLEIVRDNGDIELTRGLWSKEKWFIQNERALCYSDAQYFKTRYCLISDERNNLIHYTPRKSQEVFHSIVQDLDEAQVSIEIQALKARQVGISTEVELDFTHRLCFVPGAKAVAASADGQKSELMAAMFYTVIDNLPWWLRPGIKKNRRSGARGMVEFHTGSIVAIQSGNQDTGIGQGWTPTCAHISECCDYLNAKMTLEEGLMRAMHSSPSLFLVLESTGNGNTGWWADTWRSSKEFYWEGRARLLPVFIPWFMATDLYPEAGWLEKFKIPFDWKPAKETVAHANKCMAYVRNTKLFSKIMGSRWEMPREQMWFWEFNYQEHKRKNIAKSWLRQMPADDNEALLGKNEFIFSPETIEVITKRVDPIRVYGVIGDGVDEQAEPATRDVDYEKDRIEIGFETKRGEQLDWMLVPLQDVDPREESTAMGKLLVFEDPIPGCDYTITGDTAEGIGGDRSVINVNRRGISDDKPDIQVAEFCSDLISTAQASSYMACLGAWYGPRIPTWGLPLMAIEQRRKPGDDCQLQLIRMGFYRHYRFHRLDGKKVEEDERRSNRLGWYTNEWSRPFMFGRLIDAVENGWLLVNSPYCIRELQNLEQKHTTTGKSRMEHMDGKHDDRVFAIGIGYVVAHTPDVMIERAKKRYNVPKSLAPELDRTFYTPNQHRVSLLSEKL